MANLSKLPQDYFYAMVIRKNGTLELRKFSWDIKNGPFYCVPSSLFDLSKQPEIARYCTNIENLKEGQLRNIRVKLTKGGKAVQLTEAAKLYLNDNNDFIISTSDGQNVLKVEQMFNNTIASQLSNLWNGDESALDLLNKFESIEETNDEEDEELEATKPKFLKLGNLPPAFSRQLDNSNNQVAIYTNRPVNTDLISSSQPVITNSIPKSDLLEEDLHEIKRLFGTFELFMAKNDTMTNQLVFIQPGTYIVTLEKYLHSNFGAIPDSMVDNFYALLSSEFFEWYFKLDRSRLDWKEFKIEFLKQCSKLELDNYKMSLKNKDDFLKELSKIKPDLKDNIIKKPFETYLGEKIKIYKRVFPKMNEQDVILQILVKMDDDSSFTNLIRYKKDLRALVFNCQLLDKKVSQQSTT